MSAPRTASRRFAGSLALAAASCVGAGDTDETAGDRTEPVLTEHARPDLNAMPAHATLPEFVEIAPGLTPADLERRVAQFAPVTLTFDESLLDSSQKSVLKHLVEASDQLDAIFLDQVWSRNTELRGMLLEREGPGIEAARAYFDIMYGAWDRLEEDEPFLNVGPKPEGAGYYSEEVSREGLERWLDEHPQDQEAFGSYFTVIDQVDRELVAIPYSTAYRDRLEPAATALKAAAPATENPSLARFLTTRAGAFLSNDYFDSDVAWMRLVDNVIDPTIGPYEVYEDRLFGYKAAFESFIGIKDPAESKRLESLVAELPALEQALPVPDEHKYLDRPFTSPISVVDLAYAAGDTRAGVQTIAFNLPNDPRVREQEGSKKVMLKNVIQAKFETILRPLAIQVLAPDQAAVVGEEEYFTRVLMHELAHGLGPDYVTGGDGLTVNRALRDRYSATEEAKADAVGTHSLAVLTSRGVYTQDFLDQVYIGHVADLFRCMRFGISEAHGKGCLSQFNYLREAGAIAYDPAAERFSVDLAVIPAVMSELAGRYLMVEATGDYAGAGAFFDKYGQISPELETALKRLESVPVDIVPSYSVVEMMAGW
jgi:hypothetical protein